MDLGVLYEQLRKRQRDESSKYDEDDGLCEPPPQRADIAIPPDMDDLFRTPPRCNNDDDSGGIFVGTSFPQTTYESNNDDSEDADIDGCIPTKPPGVDEIEQRLGPADPDDEWCYLRDGVNLYDIANLTEETKKIRDDIIVGASTHKDLVALAKQIQEDYNRTIWEPEQTAAKAAHRPPSTNLRPWTLRSIYNFIRKGDMNKQALSLNVLRDLSDIANDIRNNGLYVRKKDKNNSKIHVAKGGLGMYLKVVQRFGQVCKLLMDMESDQLRQSKTKGGGGHAGSSFTSISAINVTKSAQPTVLEYKNPFPAMWK